MCWHKKSIQYRLSVYNKQHCGLYGSFVPTGLCSGWPGTAQGPKFKIPLPRSFVLGHRIHMPSVTDVSPTASEPKGFENVELLTPYGQTSFD